MSKIFDPYYRWLAIPPKHQPPDYYRLLGVEQFEEDLEVIRDAAERQMRHVRSYELGEHGALAQKILNELARAKACLLDAKRKAAYDEELCSRKIQLVPLPVISDAAIESAPPRIWPIGTPSVTRDLSRHLRGQATEGNCRASLPAYLLPAR